jgi:hypothetical protein
MFRLETEWKPFRCIIVKKVEQGPLWYNMDSLCVL